MEEAHDNPTRPDAELVLVTLGGGVLYARTSDGQLEQLVGPGKHLAVLIYLALSPRRSASRDHLIDVLWADLAPSDARHALRQAIWYLRQRAGEDVILSRNGDLVLGVELDLDRDAFLAAIERGDLDEAVRRYRGDFLAGFATPGGAEFEQWADVERYRLQLAYAEAAESLARRHLTEGHLREAQRIARDLRDLAPQRQRSWRLLLETLLASGDRVQAVGEADALTRMLEAEGREPEPATAEMLHRALQGESTQDASRAQADVTVNPLLHPELIGREEEFAAILRAWDAARGGTPQHVRIVGAAGLGKTRLLSDVAARLRAGGGRTVNVRAHPADRDMPFALAGDLAGKLATLSGSAAVSGATAAILVGLDPALSGRYAAQPDRAAGNEAPRRRALALRELLAAVADEGPVAVFLDDLHWSDAESLRLLQGLAARLERDPVLLVTTERPLPTLGVSRPDSLEIELASLTPTHVGEIVASIARLPTDEAWAGRLVRTLYTATAGSPLLIIESLQLALERGTLAIDELRWSCLRPEELFTDLEAGASLRHRIEQLDRSASWVLQLLALAGMPLTLDQLATAANRSAEDLLMGLAALERRGFVARMGNAYQPGHDEMIHVAQELMSADAIRAAHASLGAALLDLRERPGASTVVRACRHLARSGDQERLALAARDWLAWAYRGGEQRTVGTLLAELLDADPRSAEVRRLAARMPFRWRAGLTSPLRVGLVAAAGVVLLAAVAFALRADRPAFVVHYVPRAGGGREVLEIPVPRELARAGGVLDLARAKPARRAPYDGFLTLPQPGGSHRASSLVTEDGGQEVTLVAPDGGAERVTFSAGDDSPGAWSPDGRYLVIVTDRWDERSRSDLGVAEIAEGRAPEWYPLTLDPDSRDVTPSWSPDGSRIAFQRLYYDGRPTEVCVVSFDGSRLRCLRPEGFTVDQLQSWVSTARVVAKGYDDAGQSEIRMVNVETGASTHVAWGHLSAAGPGGWIACICRRERGQPMRSRLLSTLRPDADILLTGDPPPSFWATAPGGTTDPYLDRLEVRAPAGILPRGGSARLDAEGRDQHGRELAIPPLTWSSLDTTVARVDTTGLLRTLREGQVRIVASAGGWRADTVRLEIGPGDVTIVMREEWEGDFTERWRPFGIPRPQVVSTEHGDRAFWHHGDSTYPSGAYTRTTFDPRAGVGVEAALSTTVTDVQWQTLNLWIVPYDRTALAVWDHEDGAPPPASPWSYCTASYPGDPGLGSGILQTTGLMKRGPTPPEVATGAWWRLRVQVFPDGRCGIAVNGRAVVLSDAAITLDRPVYLRIGGRSHNTRMLVGPLEVWTGVKLDVEWEELPEGG